jgi:aminopeptidase-like protein
MFPIGQIKGGKFVGYHCTARENLESIMKYGLCPEKFAKMGFWEGAEENKKYVTVYFSTEPNNGFGDLCLEVDLTGLHITFPSKWEMISWCGTIPPERIKVYKGE